MVVVWVTGRGWRKVVVRGEKIPSLAGCKRKLKGRNRLDNRRWRSVGGAGKLEIACQPRNRERERRWTRERIEKPRERRWGRNPFSLFVLNLNAGFFFREKRRNKTVAGATRGHCTSASLATRHANARRPFSSPPLSCSFPSLPSFRHNDFSNELQSLAIPENIRIGDSKGASILLLSFLEKGNRRQREKFLPTSGKKKKKRGEFEDNLILEIREFGRNLFSKSLILKKKKREILKVSKTCKSKLFSKNSTLKNPKNLKSRCEKGCIWKLWKPRERELEFRII